MRIRTIKPEFFKHDGLAELPPVCRLLFVGLWCLADRRGRLEDRPLRIRIEVLPYEERADVDGMLGELHRAGFIARYQTADGLRLVQIVNFERHQRITGKEAEAESKFPPPPSGETTWKHPGNTRDDGNGRETEGKGSGLPPTAARLTDASAQNDPENPESLEKSPETPHPAPDTLTKPEKARKSANPPPPDALFAALATACGRNPDGMTKREARAAAVALAEIRRACPDVTPDEFTRRAANYRANFRDAALTPSALAAHWSACEYGPGRRPAAEPVTPPPAPVDTSTAPANWRERIGSALLSYIPDGAEWPELNEGLRRRIVRECDERAA